MIPEDVGEGGPGGAWGAFGLKVKKTNFLGAHEDSFWRPFSMNDPKGRPNGAIFNPKREKMHREYKKKKSAEINSLKNNVKKEKRVADKIQRKEKQQVKVPAKTIQQLR